MTPEPMEWTVRTIAARTAATYVTESRATARVALVTSLLCAFQVSVVDSSLYREHAAGTDILN